MKRGTQTIWDFVKELLHEHDCVIVPGFGGFVCNLQPARIDQVSHVITPPARHVVFNQNLKTNDGLLASRIAGQLKLSYSDAVRMIDETVNQTRDLLQNKKTFAVELFGSFRLNADANYVFLPDRTNNFLHASYGLMPLHADPVAGRSIRSRKVRIFKDRKELHKARKMGRTRNMMRVLGGTFVLLLALNVFIFIKDPQLGLDGTSMNISAWFDSIFHSSSQPVTTPVVVVPAAKQSVQTASAPAIESAPEVNTIEEKTATPAPLSFAELMAASKVNAPVPVMGHVEPAYMQPVIAQPQHITTASDSSFYIIGGVFCKEKNAMRFFHELEEKGYHPDLITNPELHCSRVSYAKYASRKEAEQQLRAIHASVNNTAWILAR